MHVETESQMPKGGLGWSLLYTKRRSGLRVRKGEKRGWERGEGCMWPLMRMKGACQGRIS